MRRRGCSWFIVVRLCLCFEGDLLRKQMVGEMGAYITQKPLGRGGRVATEMVWRL